MNNDKIDHPSYYGGKDNPYEAIKVIDAWELDFALGNAVKYISRVGKKHPNKVEDLRKAAWYLNHAIELELKNEDNIPIRKDTERTRHCLGSFNTSND